MAMLERVKWSSVVVAMGFGAACTRGEPSASAPAPAALVAPVAPGSPLAGLGPTPIAPDPDHELATLIAQAWQLEIAGKTAEARPILAGIAVKLAGFSREHLDGRELSGDLLADGSLAIVRTRRRSRSSPTSRPAR